MALPAYATPGQKVGYYSFLTYCGLVFFFLIAPIFIILPLSFSASPFFEFTRGFMHFDPEHYSLRWYKQMVGNWIAYHLKTTLNWGLCASLGAILLAVMTVLYWAYNKIVGIENIKLG